MDPHAGAPTEDRVLASSVYRELAIWIESNAAVALGPTACVGFNRQLDLKFEIGFRQIKASGWLGLEINAGDTDKIKCCHRSQTYLQRRFTTGVGIGTKIRESERLI